MFKPLVLTLAILGLSACVSEPVPDGPSNPGTGGSSSSSSSSGSVGTPPTTPPAEVFGDAVAGKKIYTEQCSNCHGPNGNDGAINAPITHDKCVTCGTDITALTKKINTNMPAAEVCTGQCAVDVATYIYRSFGDQPTVSACEPGKLSPGKALIRRLNKREYINTVVDLLGVDAALTSNILDEQAGGFDTNADVLATSGSHVEAYEITARALAEEAIKDLPKLTGCNQKNLACAQTFVKNFGSRAFRRPITKDETDSLIRIHGAAYKNFGFDGGIRLMLEAILQSPSFLYREEFGVAGTKSAGSVQLSSWEVATRLSYMFWATTPDKTLQDLAAQDKLRDKVVIRQQAERLLADNRAKAMVQNYFSQWLHLGDVLDITRDPADYPGYNDNIPGLMIEETKAFIDHIFWNGEASFDELLTADFTFVNNELAKFYGMAGTGSAAFALANNPNRNFGLLSQGSFNASRARDVETAPILRGVFVLEKLMCVHIPEPNPDDDLDIVFPPADSTSTTRQRWEKMTSKGACAVCHRLLNPAGFVLESFDPVGRWRENENGIPIDTLSNILGTDIDGAFSSVGDLVASIANSEQAMRCAVTTWADYAYGRHIKNLKEDKCNMDKTYDAFVGSGKNMKEILVSLTQTDAFLYKTEVN